MGAISYDEEIKARSDKEALTHLKADSGKNSPYSIHYYAGLVKTNFDGEVLLTVSNRSKQFDKAYKEMNEWLFKGDKYDVKSIKVGIDHYVERKIEFEKIPEGIKQVSKWAVIRFNDEITYHDTKTEAMKDALYYTRVDGRSSYIEKRSIFINSKGMKVKFKHKTVITEKKTTKPNKFTKPVYEFIFFGWTRDEERDRW